MQTEATQDCIRVDIEVRPQAKELLFAGLFRFGVTTFEEQPGDAQAARGGEIVRCYLSSQAEVEHLDTFLRDYLAASGTGGELSIAVSQVPPQDWHQLWKEHWRGSAVGSRLYVAPSWLETEVPPGRIPILLDPGMAFGTGSHETTMMCLEWLEDLITSGGADSFLDVGCGSGILSIAAAKLGVPRVLGIDVEDAAIAAAKANAEINALHQCRFEKTAIADISERFSLVCANIISSVLSTIWDDLHEKLLPEGRLIVSGLLVSERDAWSKRTVLRLLEAEKRGEWLSVVYGKTPLSPKA